MAQGIVDPEDLRRYASFLASMAGSLREKEVAITADFASLHDVWRDAKYEAFDAVLTQSLKQLEQFLRQSENYVRYLHAKAELAERITERRYYRGS